MSKFTKYKSVAECRARKITEDDGETVITANGAVHADKGSYEVHVQRDEGRVEVSVVDGDSFERQWKSQSSGSSKSTSSARKSTSRRSTSKSATPRKST